MAKGLKKGLLTMLAAFGLLVEQAKPLMAQGCVMCKTTAAGAVANSPAAAQAATKINIGVLVLLIPVATLFISIFILFYRYRNLSQAVLNSTEASASWAPATEDLRLEEWPS